MSSILPDDLRLLLRLALLTHDEIVALAGSDDSQPRIPILPDLIKSILFSRRFVPTYIAILAAVTLLHAAAYWYRRRKCTTSHDRQGHSTPSIASSSSSTLQGTEISGKCSGTTDERTLLLSENQDAPPFRRNVLVRSWHRVQSLLLHQPTPLPALTAPKNSLPTNQTSLLILFILGLNVFYLFYGLPLSRQMIFAFADRAGLLFVVNIPVLYLLAAKNSQPFQFLTGWSYEGLNIFHRRLGELMTILAVLHAIGMVIAFYDLIAPFGYTLWWYLTRKIIVLGCIAFLSYMVIYATSIGYLRQSSYELFLVLHVLAQVVALVMLFFHHHDARPYVVAALIIWAIDRIVARIVMKRKSFVARLQIADDQTTVLMFIDISVLRAIYPGLQYGWHAGQHVFVAVPSINKTQILQSHPFTIASPAPPVNAKGSSWPLQLTVRAQNGFSKQLLDYAKHHQHTVVHLDGPYSSDTVLQAVRQADRVCLIAGGSGVAVTYPFAWDCQVSSQSPEDHDIIRDMSVYANGSRRIPNVVKNSSAVDSTRFAHFWVRQDSRHESWLKLLPRSVSQNSSDEAEHAMDLVTHRFDTRTALGEHHRPDIKLELDSWVRGAVNSSADITRSICVVVSGPDGLVRDVQNAVASLIRQGWSIEVRVEKFGW